MREITQMPKRKRSYVIIDCETVGLGVRVDGSPCYLSPKTPTLDLVEKTLAEVDATFSPSWPSTGFDLYYLQQRFGLTPIRQTDFHTLSSKFLRETPKSKNRTKNGSSDSCTIFPKSQGNFFGIHKHISP